MKLLLATDIFGINPALRQLQSTLAPLASTIDVVDPYAGKEHHFETEAQAYPAFLSHGGHDHYFAHLVAAAEQCQPDAVIGFSSGATAAWRLANEPSITCQQVMGFYPSLVVPSEHLTEMTQTTIIFPSQESIFDVSDALSRLAGTANLMLEVFEGAHGFMNPVCSGFDPQLYDQGMALIARALEPVMA